MRFSSLILIALLVFNSTASASPISRVSGWFEGVCERLILGGELEVEEASSSLPGALIRIQSIADFREGLIYFYSEGQIFPRPSQGFRQWLHRVMNVIESGASPPELVAHKSKINELLLLAEVPRTYIDQVTARKIDQIIFSLSAQGTGALEASVEAETERSPSDLFFVSEPELISYEDWLFFHGDLVFETKTEAEVRILWALSVFGLEQADVHRHLRARYLALAQRYHPDRPEGSAAMMQLINEARSILQSP